MYSAFFFSTLPCFGDSEFKVHVWQAASCLQLIEASPVTIAYKTSELFAVFLPANPTWMHYQCNISLLFVCIQSTKICLEAKIESEKKNSSKSGESMDIPDAHYMFQ